jgi:amidase
MRKFIAGLWLTLATSAMAEQASPSLDVSHLDVAALQRAYDSGAFDAEAVTRAYLARIAALDREGPALNAVLSLNPRALERARALDLERQSGQSRGPLHGVPVLIKDNINTADMPTTAGSIWLKDVVPPQDAFIVARLREQGAIILGKTNLSEWANFHSNRSSSGWSRLGGQVRNPYDTSRNPCGSSSGSGVAAAASLATLAVGTETNGSIVCPANANGIVGMKPTVGLWSRSGIIPISHSSDSAGPMTRNVRDAAILLGALAVEDSADDKTVGHSEQRYSDYTQFLDPNALQGKRLGLWTSPMGQHHRVERLTRAAVAALKAHGAEVVEIERISEEDIGADAFNVLLYEFHHGMNQYLASLGEASPFADYAALMAAIDADVTAREQFDRGLLRLALTKDGLGSEEYQTALARMLEYSREKGIDRVLAEHRLDAIIAPTGSPAWKTDLLLGDNFVLASSSPSARAGYPIISVPMGAIAGLPVGLSFFAEAWSEPKLLALAYAFEQATQHRQPPPF